MNVNPEPNNKPRNDEMIVNHLSAKELQLSETKNKHKATKQYLDCGENLKSLSQSDQQVSVSMQMQSIKQF